MESVSLSLDSSKGTQEVNGENLKEIICKYIGQIKNAMQMISIRRSKDLTGFDMAFCFSFYCLLIMFFPTEPPDDLLRHMKAYTYGYDYRQMWPFSPGLPSFDMYYLFDVFTGAVHHALGPFSFVIIQVLAISLFAVAIYWMLQGASSRNWRFHAHDDHPDSRAFQGNAGQAVDIRIRSILAGAGRMQR